MHEFGVTRSVRCSLPAASLAVIAATLPSLAHADDPTIRAITRDVSTSYSWLYESGVKQQQGSYKNGRSLHAVTQRVGTGAKGSPDYLLWVDEHSGQILALQR